MFFEEGKGKRITTRTVSLPQEHSFYRTGIMESLPPVWLRIFRNIECGSNTRTFSAVSATSKNRMTTGKQDRNIMYVHIIAQQSLRRPLDRFSSQRALFKLYPSGLNINVFIRISGELFSSISLASQSYLALYSNIYLYDEYLDSPNCTLAL